LPAMIAPVIRVMTQANHQILSKWLKRATSTYCVQAPELRSLRAGLHAFWATMPFVEVGGCYGEAHWIEGYRIDKLELLKSISFGARVAEDEINELAKYFVETDQWSRMIKGEIDVVRGDKGAGKSAIYSLLITRESEFFDLNTLLVPGEKPRGTPVFKDIIANPPTAEVEFVGLWKLYILALVGRKMREWEIKGAAAEKVYSALESARLLDREYDLSGLLRAAQDLARRLFKAESVEGGLTVDPATGLPNGITGKITLREPAPALRDQGFLTADR
jgi:hypothetical protein